MTLHLDARPGAVTLGLSWHDTSRPPPASLVAAELVFFVALARLAPPREARSIGLNRQALLEVESTTSAGRRR